MTASVAQLISRQCMSACVKPVLSCSSLGSSCCKPIGCACFQQRWRRDKMAKHSSGLAVLQPSAGQQGLSQLCAGSFNRITIVQGRVQHRCLVPVCQAFYRKTGGFTMGKRTTHIAIAWQGCLFEMPAQQALSQFCPAVPWMDEGPLQVQPWECHRMG